MAGTKFVAEIIHERFITVAIYTVKYPYIHGDFVAVPLKHGKLATKCPWIYGYCLQCIGVASFY